MTSSFQNTRGFSLIEAIVAVAILLVAIGGPLTLANQGLSVANFAKQQVIATYLAQETVEFVRNIRDTNIINAADWQDGLALCIGASAACTIDVPNGNVAACGAAGCPLLRRDGATGLFGYGSGGAWEDTEFTRVVRITAVSDDEMAVSSSVSWNSGFNTKTVTIQDNLLRWAQ